ncbi:type II restriction endonuclease [Pseudoclavibacter soli]|uniref:type II restriction endonuclease n=1 Tax=Pseudoclavibacter soli TaxID=452623 RepID=UPI000423EFC2|nr:type II restriction endonuclease [Pseudoclavibacter soli]
MTNSDARGYSMESTAPSPLAERALAEVEKSELSFAKTLAANDTGATGGHQSGVLINKRGGRVLFPQGEPETSPVTEDIEIAWQPAGTVTQSKAKWYSSKGEYRVTGGFGKVIGAENAGDLFILIRVDESEYLAFVLSTEADIEFFRSSTGISPAESSALLEAGARSDNGGIGAEIDEDTLISLFVSGLDDAFPAGSQVAAEARRICELLGGGVGDAIARPDRRLLEWVDLEYRLFQRIEEHNLLPVVRSGFRTLQEFIDLANSVKNRRASRAGHSLEYHVEALLIANRVAYTAQGRTELHKRPDFLLPSEDAYHDPAYPSKALSMLAVKTTCKDRWRQVISEADRIQVKHLLTLQQSISAHQIEEMTDAGIQLVVPRRFHPMYPAESRSRLMSVEAFLRDAPKLS